MMDAASALHTKRATSRMLHGLFDFNHDPERCMHDRRPTQTDTGAWRVALRVLDHSGIVRRVGPGNIPRFEFAV